MINNQVKLFHTSSGKQIKVTFVHATESTLEITAQNLDYKIERCSRFKYLMTVVTLYIFYLLIFRNNYYLIIHLGFISSILFVVQILFNLVESESIKLVKNFALHTSSTYSFGRVVNFFVPINYIHNIIINEVVYNYKVIFVLTALTKGEIHYAKPIIPLMNNLHPELDCVEIIYKKIQCILSDQ